MGNHHYQELPCRLRTMVQRTIEPDGWLRRFVPAHVTDADEPFLRGFLGRCCSAVMRLKREVNVLEWWRESTLYDQPHDDAEPQLYCIRSAHQSPRPGKYSELQRTNVLLTMDVDVVNIAWSYIYALQPPIWLIELTPNGVIDRLTTFDEFRKTKGWPVAGRDVCLIFNSEWRGLAQVLTSGLLLLCVTIWFPRTDRLWFPSMLLAVDLAEPEGAAVVEWLAGSIFSAFVPVSSGSGFAGKITDHWGDWSNSRVWLLTTGFRKQAQHGCCSRNNRPTRGD